MDNNKTKVRLTQTVQKGGCAAKVAATELRKILKNVDFPPRSKSVLIDGSGFDDAAVIQVTPDLALVQTLDFFTPIVDSPFIFGQIASANALSDIYAMGGRPQTALAILAFPLANLDSSIASEILQGCSSTLKNAECSLVGGHSIDDETLKFGLSAHGTVHPKKIWSNQGAKPGDDLILTKALGTGTLMAALKREAYKENEIMDAIDSMCSINSILPLLDEKVASSIHAATDVTGFGLLGHALHIAEGSNVSLLLNFKDLPYFNKVFSCLESGFLTKAHRTNKEYVQEKILFSSPINELEKLLLFDPQTSGGLLLAVDSKYSSKLVELLGTKFPMTRHIGKALEKTNYACQII